MSHVVLLVGPPGSGKSTLAKEYEAQGYIRISQDSQGQKEHLVKFINALDMGLMIVVDRMNFNVGQRRRYLDPAKAAGYKTSIIVLHVPMEECLARCAKRTGHETIKDQATAEVAVRRFFTSYERVEDSEADTVERDYSFNQKKNKIIVCDLDGTLADIKHRRHFLNREEGRKPNWKAFFDNMDKDEVHGWCRELLDAMSARHRIVYATGRPEDYMPITQEWLEKNGLIYPGYKLFSRLKGDHRADTIVKEIILDFEIRPRYDILMIVDDRASVVAMWRKHGYTVLQCDVGDF
jgi:predicted kinase